MNIAGNTALVTGAGGNLGSAMVQGLLESGAACIIAVDRDAQKLSSFTDARIICITGDLGAFSGAQAALTAAYAAAPVIDILINAAGLLYSAPLVNIFEKTDDYLAVAARGWDSCLSANLSSTFYVSQQVANRMVKARTKGIIITVSSVTASGNSGQSAYAASKAGVNALTSVWAKELGPMGIRAVAIAPGYIDTPSTHSAVSEAHLKDITQRIPLKTLGAPEAIVQAMRFAIENDYVNGTVLEIDGGLVV